ncbi:MAG TPA: hypothetical protein VN428_11910 [Bryobacteraceae bacterium]|nr:hypothetical protein [Bryobacteraceae bacterium]
MLNDCTVQWNGQKWQIPKVAARPGLRGSSVRIEERLDGMMVARINGAAVPLEACSERQPETEPAAKPPRKRFVPKPGQSRWMDGFQVESTAAWKAYREHAGAAVSAPLRSPSGLPPQG